MRNAPGTAPAVAANGRALFRKGKIVDAEKAWHEAIKLDANNVSAIEGLSRIYYLTAHFRTAQRYLGIAHRLAPDDPGLMIAWANTLHGAEHVDALKRALAIYDPATREARSLLDHIASDEALGDTKLRALTSDYRAEQIPLLELNDGPGRPLRGYGLKVSFNGHRPVSLLLDTGASGIALAPRLAQKLELKQLSEHGGEAGGIGDRDPRPTYRFLASRVEVGNVKWENVPLSVFNGANDADYDGLIGADTFARFLITLDFPNHLLRLEPFPQQPADEREVAEDTVARPSGLFPIFRRGHGLLLPTLINKDTDPQLFLIDTGSSSNLIDTAAARNTTRTHADGRTVLKGIQGRVKEVSRADQVTLTFAGFRQSNPNLIALDLTRQGDNSGIAIGGILGMPVLRNLKVTLDYRDNAVGFDYKPR